MQIIFNRQQIINTVAPLLCAVGNKATNPAVECILIEATGSGITLTTYDLEKGVRSEAEGRIIEEGSYCINAGKFFQTLKVMEGDEVTLCVSDNLETSITSGKSFYKMSALRAEDFPALPTISGNYGFEVSSKRLREMISKVTYAMGVNDQRQVLNGAYFRVTNDRLLVVACDSFKLARCSCAATVKNLSDDTGDLKYQYIVPQKTVSELLRMLPDGEDETAVVHLSRKNMICSFGGLTFFSRLIEGEYIDFDRIIIKNHKISVMVDRARFLAALERAAIVTEEKVAGSTRTPLKFTAEGNLLKLNAQSSVGVSYDEIEIEHEGADIVISFNNRNLIDSVRSCSGEKVRIELSTPLYSINIVPVDPGDGNEDLFFMMPIRTKN